MMFFLFSRFKSKTPSGKKQGRRIDKTNDGIDFFDRCPVRTEKTLQVGGLFYRPGERLGGNGVQALVGAFEARLAAEDGAGAAIHLNFDHIAGRLSVSEESGKGVGRPPDGNCTRAYQGG